LSPVFQPDDVLSYMEMCSTIGVNLQRGMNFRLRNVGSIILMSVRPGAPYADQVEDDGRTLIYEGHDIPKTVNGPNPKDLDQANRHRGGSLTQNGLFAAMRYKTGNGPAEPVKVYEKIRTGIWVYNGLFELVDCWTQPSGGRKVFKFKLRFAGKEIHDRPTMATPQMEDDRVIPSWVKLEVWKRDQGRCIGCSATSDLHFDHISPIRREAPRKTRQTSRYCVDDTT
jgi:hypothetical protein